MDQYCRLCCAKNCKLLLLFEISNIKNLEITNVLKIKEDDGLPQMSCDVCLSKIQDFISFMKTCENSYEYFRTMLLEINYEDQCYNYGVLSESTKFKPEPKEESVESMKEEFLVEKVYIKTELKEEKHGQPNNSEKSDSNEGQSKFLKNLSKLNCIAAYSNRENIIQNTNGIELEKISKIGSNLQNKLKCQYCPRTFTSDKILRRHVQNIHTNPNYKCIKCGFECTNKSNCTGHVKRKHFKELNMEFEELLQFVLEKDSNSSDANFTDLPFPCNSCTRSFAKESDLIKHKNRVHIIDPDSVKLFGCKKCGSKYTYRKTAVKHIRNIHYESRTELVKAEIDEYLIQFGQPKTQADIAKVNKNETKEENSVHECPVCHLKYSRAIILKSHFARFHMSDEEKKKRKKKIYLCQECGKNFSARSAFKYHVQTHFGEKEFKCTECSKAYYTKHLLLSHMRKHTGDTSNRQLECEICNKRWPSRTALERHMNVHGQKQARNFMCTICGNAFYSNYHLKSHMLRHTKENNYKCTEPGCNASFRADGSRKKHYYNFHVSDDQKPFSCEICQKKFFRKAYLADHLRKHGKAAEYMLNLYRQKE